MMSYARRPETNRPAIGLAGALRGAGARVILALLGWRELARQRRRLLALDDRMLKDIGITRADAVREGQRPFWDPPGADWRRWP